MTETMTRSRWLQKLSDNAKDLRQLVATYHPAARMLNNPPSMPITAPNAEAACENVRVAIRREEPEDPLVRWDRAIASADIDTMLNLLNGAWFGVPESTDCWNIPGFGVAVDLMDDLPQEEESND